VFRPSENQCSKEVNPRLEEDDNEFLQGCMENDNGFLQDCMENSEKDVNIMLGSKNQNSILHENPFVKPAIGDSNNPFKRLTLATPNQDIEGNPGPSKPEFGFFANGQVDQGPGGSFFTNYGQGLTGKPLDEIFFRDKINSNDIFSGKDWKYPDSKVTQRDYHILTGKGQRNSNPCPIKKLQKPDPTDPASDQKLPTSDQKLPPPEKWEDSTIDDYPLQFLIENTEFQPPTSKFVDHSYLLSPKNFPSIPSPRSLFQFNGLPDKQIRKIIKTRRSNPGSAHLTQSSTLDLPPYDPTAKNPTKKFWRSSFQEGYYNNGALNGPAITIDSYANIHISEFRENKKHGYGLTIKSEIWKREAEYANDKISGRIVIWRKNYFGSNMQICQGNGQWEVFFEGNVNGEYLNGYGRRNFLGGFSVVGKWCDSMLNGDGKVVLPGGDVFYGRFVKGDVNGYGEYHVKGEGKVFKGVFKSSAMKATGFWYKFGDNGKNDVTRCAPELHQHL
jgi:hypothetical protein